MLTNVASHMAALTTPDYLGRVEALAYYLACQRGYDPDMPRNLAKSVTVK